MEKVERICDLMYGLKWVQYEQILRKYAESIIDECKATVRESCEDNPAETVNRLEHIKERL